MTSIWLVTSGEYSDYCVEAAFSSEALAQAFVDEVKAGHPNHEDMSIEEMTLDVPLARLWRTVVFMHADGDTTSSYNGDPAVYTAQRGEREEDAVSFCPETKYGIDPASPKLGRCNIGTTGRIMLASTVITRDRDLAVKVTNERRAAILAADAWGDDAKANAVLFGRSK